MAKHRRSKKRVEGKTKAGDAGQRNSVDIRPGPPAIDPESIRPDPASRSESTHRRTSDHVTPAKTAASWRPFLAIIPPALALLTSINTLWNGFAADDMQQI